MAKCAIFVTTQQRADTAEAVLLELGEDNIPVYITHPLRVGGEAMGIVRSEGIQVIIARGAVATEFRKCTSLPVVDIVLTIQELGMLILEAKSKLRMNHPTIALIAQKNMFGDLSDVDVLFGVKLRTYYVDSLDDMSAATRRAANDGADIAVGGIYVQETCKEIGLPYMSHNGGKASVINALRIAKQISYTIDLQERNNAERSALLNFSFNGIIQLDHLGRIVTMNRRAESLLDIPSYEAEGQHICDLIPEIDRDRLKSEVYGSGEELFRTFWNGDDAIAVSVAPVKDGSSVRSAIVSYYDIDRMSSFEREARSTLGSYEAALDSSLSYKWLSSMAEEQFPFVRALNDAAQYEDCLLLSGGGVVERGYCAAFIRANGLRRDLPFVTVSAASYDQSEQAAALFGTPDTDGAVQLASGGTLFIDEIDKLTPECQSRLLQLVCNGQLVSGGHSQPVDVRVICGSGTDLEKLCGNGRFRRDLLLAISVNSLHIPPLAGCPNAIFKWSTYYLEKYCSQYGRFNVFTKPAKRLLAAQPWSEGHIELQVFCRLCAREATRRALDEATVARLLKASSGSREIPARHEPSSGGEKAQIQSLIDKYGGDRALIAEEMQMSKTTLWRRMKKYGLI